MQFPMATVKKNALYFMEFLQTIQVDQAGETNFQNTLFF
jgi:hypothetical protein